MKYIDLEGCSNFRDIGGYLSHENKTVKYGKIYRSDALNALTDKDILTLESLGIKTIIDYRGEKERVGKEDVEISQATVYYLDPKADVAALASAEMSDIKINEKNQFSNLNSKFVKTLMTQQNIQFTKHPESIASYRKMFDLLLDEKNIASVQHCRGGKDRTGYGVALILFALGVDKQQILEDYMLTNYYKKEKNEQSLKEFFEETKDEDKTLAMRYFKEANESFLLAAIEEIEENYSTVTNYLRVVLKLKDEEILKLKDLYLD